ncbi:hypothetical protein [Paenibacillus sp. 481]|uniref:hypothetical protein n=1 Tax=Paenibacillus sp. 481 TaxID=2835869 RepID=UPI001E5EFC62|nr:hypothetical protein [Paenibacillus sp. 481]UHA73108.1 hypothetical protein KIK04_21325 [Paenibacillus sp. 481]
MEANTRSMIEFAVACTMFMSALGLSFELVRSNTSTITALFSQNLIKDRNVNHTLTQAQAPVILGAEIVHMIRFISELSIDIEVEGHLFRPDTAIDSLDLSFIATQKRYSVVQIRDEVGKLVRLRYD